jgi:hypothetical protein
VAAIYHLYGHDGVPALPQPDAADSVVALAGG